MSLMTLHERNNFLHDYLVPRDCGLLRSLQSLVRILFASLGSGKATYSSCETVSDNYLPRLAVILVLLAHFGMVDRA